MKKLLIILGSILLVLALSAGALIYIIMGRPEYSLWQLKQAYQRQDVETVKQYVDVDVLAEQITTVVIKQVSDKAPILGGLAEKLLPKLITTSLQTNSSQTGLLSSFNNITWSDVLLRKKLVCTQADSFAYCTITGAERTIILQLQQTQQRTWKIVGIKNIDELVNDLFGDIKQQLTDGTSTANNSTSTNNITNSNPSKFPAVVTARDTKQVSDLKQLQSAVELYYSDTGTYPSASSWEELGKVLDKYLTNITYPPIGNSDYVYYVSSDKTAYVFTATLETDHAVLQSDNDKLYDASWSTSPAITAKGNHPTQVDCADTAKVFCVSN
ncbi:MAG: DUF2939 domain-containing protein [Patescibacteria group bacterium]|jgi:hypothetical protein